MSAESINIKAQFGEIVRIKNHDIKVNHVATKQKYVISQKDSAGEMVCFDKDRDVVGIEGFKEGKLIMQNWKLEHVADVDIIRGDTLKTIEGKMNDTGIVKAFILPGQNGNRIVVESVNPGIKHTFHLAGKAIKDLKVEVPQDAVKFMDIYDESGNVFSSPNGMWDEEESNSFQPGFLKIGTGIVDVQATDVVSLKWMKQRINEESNVTNIKANLVVIDDSYILRLSTKVGGSLGYTSTSNGVLRGEPEVQIRYSAAQDTEITVDHIASPFDSCDIETSEIGRLHIEAIGDNVVISGD